MSDDTPTRPGKNGGTLRSGGNHPRPGRPPNEYRQALRDIVDSEEAREALIRILKNPKHPQFASLWKAVVAQGYGNPVQQIFVDGDTLPVLKVERE